MMLLLRCPQCKQAMKYESRDRMYYNKTKRCVYCGKSFQVRDSIVRAM
ncbi:hypothetical protein KY320_01795 [Candidatus Woesearchaeota archaeon]|nr:hypothetical protein [Candidatus Woesearchaeota archaeon]